MEAFDPAILDILATVKSRAHVLDLIYQAFHDFCTAKDYDGANKVLESFLLPGHSIWLLIGALVASQEFKAKLPSRSVLYTLTFETIAFDHGAPIAQYELEGLE